MKHSFKVLFAIFLAVFATEARADFKVGPIGGLSIANLDLSGNGSTITLDSRTGIAAGVSAEFNAADWLFFQPELMYVQKGFKLSSTARGGNADLTFAANYLELPLLLKAKLVGEKASPYLLFGPSPAFKLSSSASTGNSTVSVDSVNGFDLGLQFGAGVEMNLGATTTLFLDVRYDMGLLNIDNDPADTDTTVKNNTWLILTGVRFSI